MLLARRKIPSSVSFGRCEIVLESKTGSECGVRKALNLHLGDSKEGA